MEIKIEINYIKASGVIIRLKKPIRFRVVPDPIFKGNLYVQDNFFYIHESAPTFARLADQVRDALSIQYEGIVLENDGNLSDDAISMKKYYKQLIDERFKYNKEGVK